jgi:hypothetical protein
MLHGAWRKIWMRIIVADYYLAAILLVAAGVIKIADPAVGDILNTLVDREFLSLQQMVLLYRIQPWFEIGVGLFALIGWQAQWSARIMALLYLFFSGLVYYVVEGYLAMPIACGCFGEEEIGSPAYLSFYRNVIIALLLLFFTSKYSDGTLLHFLMKRTKNV